MRKDEFLQAVEAGRPIPYDITNYNRLFKVLYTYENKLGKLISEGYSKEEYIGLLLDCRAKKAASFVMYRSIIKDYVSFLVEKGDLDTTHIEVLDFLSFEDLNQNDDSAVWYYQSIEDLLNQIDSEIEKRDPVDPTIYAAAVSSLILAWYGFAIDAIPEVLKIDVVEDGVLYNGKLTKMHADACRRLQLYRDATSYIHHAAVDTIVNYPYTEYLIRTIQNPHVNKRIIQTQIDGLNKISKGKFSLTYTNIYQSGIFHRLYLKERNNPNILKTSNLADLSDAFGCKIGSANTASRYKRDYAKYKKIFHEIP